MCLPVACSCSLLGFVHLEQAKAFFFPPAFSTLVPETGALRANCTGPAALAAPERLMGNKGSPVLAGLLSCIRIPFSSLEQHKGCSQRQEHIPRAGLCQARQLPPRLINNSPCSCIYRDGQGKGGQHSTSCRFLSSLAACFPKPWRTQGCAKSC